MTDNSWISNMVFDSLLRREWNLKRLDSVARMI